MAALIHSPGADSHAICPDDAVVIPLPVALSFDGTDHDCLGSGLTTVMPDAGSAVTSAFDPANLAVGGGLLRVTTSAGDAGGSRNTQQNALATRFDAVAPTEIRTMLALPLGFAENWDNAGIWFGLDENNYVKLVARSNDLELVIEQNGSFGGAGKSVVSPVSYSGLTSRLELVMKVTPGGGTAGAGKVEAFYSVDGQAEQSAGVLLTVPATFFTTAGPDLTPPSAPSGLSASAGDDSVVLSWTPNSEPDVAGYRVYRSTSLPVVTTSSPVSGSPLLTGSAYFDATAENDIQYHYAVVAVDLSGNGSDASAPASATPRAGGGAVPPAPTGLAATAVSTAIALTWNASAGATGYNVYRSTTPAVSTDGTPLNGSTPLTATSFTDAAVTAGVTYYYVTTAVNSAGSSPASSAVSATIASSGEWTSELALPVALQEVSVSALNGKVYLAGGDSSAGRVRTLYAFDPANPAWQSLTQYPEPARDHIGMAALGNYLYLLGGVTAWPQPSVATVQRYDLGANTWTTVAPLPLPRAAMAVAVLNGKIYAAGGLRNGQAVTDFTAYDPATDSWQTLAPLPSARDHLVGAALDGKFYAIGGRPGSSAICAPVATVHRYDPGTNAWTAVAPMTVARGGHAAGTLDGRIQVFGGEGGSGCGIIGSAEEYDPTTNAWTALSSMPTARHGTGGATIGSKVFLPGGATATGHQPTAVHQSFSRATAAYLEQGGQVVLEAERYAAQVGRSGKAWVARTDQAGFAGTGAMVAEPDGSGTTVINTGYVTTSPELRYRVSFATAGTYHVWVRAWAANDDNNSVHVGLNGQAVASADRLSTTQYGNWAWFKSTLDGPVATLPVASPGEHVINVWMREDGFRIDRLLLTTDSGLVPSGPGPAESPHTGGETAAPPPTPTGLSATPGSTAIALAWNAAPGATGYHVYRSTTSSVSTAGTPLNGTTALSTPSYSDTAVTAGVTYSYVVTAVNAAGASAPTPAVSAQLAAGVSCTTSPTPTLLNFSGTVPGTYASSGFNCYLPGTVAPTGAGLALSGFNSHLVVTSTNGDMYQGATTQANALALRAANSGSYAARVRIKGPFAATVPYQAAGVVLGLDADHYAKLVVGQSPAGSRLEFGVETGAVFTRPVADVPFDPTALDSASEAVDLWLVRQSSGAIEALYRTITNLTGVPVFGPIVSMGVTGSVPGWSLASAELYAGLVTTDTGSGGAINTVFDDFELGSPVTQSGAPPSISFTTKPILKQGTTSGTAFGVSGFVNPTSLALGPDGKLYVATQGGKIYIVSLDPQALTTPNAVAVTQVQTLLNIYNRPTRTCNIGGVLTNCQYLSGTPTGRQVTGLAIGPESTLAEIVLYVSHADPRIGTNNSATALAIDTWSSAITRLRLQPAAGGTYAVATEEDLIVGLPRSRENHAVNAIAFGPDGWMYFTVGGNTNYGKPSTFFSMLPEYYLAAAALRLNLAALDGRTLPINVEGVAGAAAMAPLAGVLELFATGFRNAYDLTWHSNGQLYLNENAGNNGLGNTPDSADGCDTPSINPGSLPDTLHRVVQGTYGGHPNPARGECVLKGGTQYSPPLGPHPNYLPSLLSYNQGASTNGIVEYVSNAFDGQMKGNLISATYAGNQNVRRVVLNAAGTGVVQEVNLGAFSQPLDITTDASGIIYVAEHGADQITLLIPNQAFATCPNPSLSDDDGDGYTDGDEQLHGTDPCSAASFPPDFDGDFVGDESDSNLDGDGLPNATDQLSHDPLNGSATTLPLAFEWNPGDPPLGAIGNTGFTGAQIPSSGPRVNTSLITVGAAGGFMAIGTSSGTAEGPANNQVNALQIGFDSTAPFRVWSLLVEPFNVVTPAPGHVAGIFFGPNQDNFVRAAIVGGSGGEQAVQLGLEQGGTFTELARSSLGFEDVILLDLFLIGDPGTNTISAYYRLDDGAPVLLADVVVPAGWFGSNQGAAAGSSLAGVMTSHGAAISTAFVYDFFRIDRNTTPGAAPPYLEQDGLLVIEAERYDDMVGRNGKSWVARTNTTGYAGTAAMVAEPDTDAVINTGFASSAPELRYSARFSTPGTYHVWIRALANDDDNNSVHVGSNGQAVATADRLSTTQYGQWTWFNGTLDGPAATLQVPSAGDYTINVWMREDAFRLDRLLLTTSSTMIPSGLGPPESPRQ
jgi:N-acetylneuraminic acid mutarotase/fibronectin type 3 domain-containing protein